MRWSVDKEPKIVVYITHDGTQTSYGESSDNVFNHVEVKMKENSVKTATLTCPNKRGFMYPQNVELFDAVIVQIFNVLLADWQEVFRGTVRKVEPVYGDSESVTLKCKGLGVALEATNCSGNYGYTSENPTKDTIQEIVQDLVTNYVNKSYGSANNTGYSIDSTLVDNIDAALSIPFMNFPYRTCKSVIDKICMLDTAYRNGATAGPHWIVEGSSGFLRVKTIGSQQTTTDSIGHWGKYCGGLAETVTLTEGVDFTGYQLLETSGQYANNIVLCSDLRKPAHDYLCEDSGPTWGNWQSTDSYALDQFVVGSHSLKFSPDPIDNLFSGVFYPSTHDWGLDIEKWGSQNTIPTVNFYIRSDTTDAYGANTGISIGKDWDGTVDASGNEDRFALNFSNLIGTPQADKWYHVSIPIGDYAVLSPIFKEADVEWIETGAPDWADIDFISFGCFDVLTTEAVWIDDLHFSGKIIREAVDTSEVTANSEVQLPLILQDSIDDSAVATDDTGMAGAMAYAELLRHVNIPKTIKCNIGLCPSVKAGEYFSMYIQRRPYNAGDVPSSYYYENGVDYRVLEAHHVIDSKQGGYTALTLTDDVLNSYPVTALNQTSILNEYLLVNNEEAKNMRSSGQIDLLIEHLRKTY